MLKLLMEVLNDQACYVAFPRKDDGELRIICEMPSLNPTTTAGPHRGPGMDRGGTTILLLSWLSSSAAQMIYLVLLEMALTFPSPLKRRPSGLL